MVRRVLVLASTFPTGDEDTVPAFVRDQLVAMHAADPDLRLDVLAPHSWYSPTTSHRSLPAYREHRFHYVLPRRWERLTGRGIMPALRETPALHLVLPFFVVAEAVAAVRLARQVRPDVVYAHWFTPQAITGYWAARAAGCPLVFTTHASDVSVWRKIPWVGPAVVRFHVRRTARLTAVSRRSMERLRSFFDEQEWTALSDRTQILPMGVHLDGGPVATDGGSERTILFLGRLAEKKGVSYLLRALAAAAPRLPGWRLVVAGDGPLRRELEGEVQRLGLGERVDFVGYVTGAAKAELLGRASVYVVPSIITDDGDAEGLPVSLLEGLAAGAVCVATRESGADDILTDDVDGFLVPERDAGSLADALVRACTLPPERRADLSSRARALAERFSWERIARQYIDFLLKGL